MKKSCLLLCALVLFASAELTLWNEDADKIPDDLVVQVASGEEPIMIIFYKDQTHKSRLEAKLKDSKELADDDFYLANVDMNSSKYMDLARDVKISTASDRDYPIVGIFKNGKGFVVKQYDNDETIDEVVKKFHSLS